MPCGAPPRAVDCGTYLAPEDSEVDIVHAAKQGDVDRFWLPLRRILGQDVKIMGAESARTKAVCRGEASDEVCVVPSPCHVPCHLSD